VNPYTATTRLKALVTPPLTCRRCGRSFSRPPHVAGGRPAFCSDACRFGPATLERHALRSGNRCRHCGADLSARRPQTRWCSQSCKKRADRARAGCVPRDVATSARPGNGAPR